MLFEANRATLSQAEPCQGGLLCECSSALVESEPKRTTNTALPMAYSSGLRSGDHRSMVRFALTPSGSHQEVVHCGTLPDRFGKGTVRLTLSHPMSTFVAGPCASLQPIVDESRPKYRQSLSKQHVTFLLMDYIEFGIDRKFAAPSFNWCITRIGVP